MVQKYRLVNRIYGKQWFAVILFLACSPLFGQGKQIPIAVSLFNESTSVPFTRFLTTPIHPGIQLGTELNYKVKVRHRLLQAFNISYFYHNHLNQGIALNSEFGYEYRIKSGLAFTSLLGIGYMHTFATAEEYTFLNGVYTKENDKGNARLYPSVSFEAGYYLNKTEIRSAKIFIRYQTWAEYPYSPGFIPVMTHINLHLGVKFFIKIKH